MSSSSIPALLYERKIRSLFPTCCARACVFISCEWPDVIANSPSTARILRVSGAPIISQKAAFPAAVAMPMPDGPPLTSLVRSVVSECPDRGRMPRFLACCIKGWLSRSLSLRRFANASFPLLNPSASIESIDCSGSAAYLASPVFVCIRSRDSPIIIHKAYVTGALCPPANMNLSAYGCLGRR